MTTTTHEMGEWKGEREVKGGLPDPELGNRESKTVADLDDDDTLLPEHEFDRGEISDDDEDEDEDAETASLNGRGGLTSRRKFKSAVWIVLCTIATLNGRSILTGGFPYPMHYILLVQLGAYTAVAIVVVLLRLRNFSTPRRKGEERYKWWEYLLMGFRILLSSSIASVAMLCGAEALLHFPNLPLLAMLPIVTYVFDSILFRLAYTLYLIPRYQDISFYGFYRVFFVVAGVATAVPFDYRLNVRALAAAVAGYFLFSLSKVASKIGPRIQQKGTYTWESPLQVYLLAGIPPMVLASYATSKYENFAAASSIAQSWSLTYRLINLGPAVLLQILFSSTMNTAYPFTSQEHVGGALEESSESARDAAASTLQAGFWIMCLGVLGRERNLIDWIQVIAFMTIYIICAGPKAIGYYPPRALNLVLRALRRRPIPIRSEPWQFVVFLLMTVTIFAVLMSSNIMLWVDTIAYNRSLGSWLDPKTLTLDTMYRPPVLRSFDMVIAHSAGDPKEAISNLIRDVAAKAPIQYVYPKIKIYTQDPNFAMTKDTANDLREGTEFQGEVSIQTLRDVGGVSAAFLHHILYSWETMPVQSLFLSTSTAHNGTMPLLIKRLENYFIAPAFPLPDALPKSGFLNLGEYETCSCNSCVDTLGWEDSFHLVPSMWAAARPNTKNCDSVLLTYGNNFIATAARVRGVKREVWQLLYDALTNEDLTNAWAHADEKLPKLIEGELGKGRWAEGAVYGQKDSLRRPYLGMTVERLWAVLLQCSEGRVAWRCPSLEVGWRLGGTREDCGCVD